MLAAKSKLPRHKFRDDDVNTRSINTKPCDYRTQCDILKTFRGARRIPHCRGICAITPAAQAGGRA
jgi:hypothetical protein